MSVRPVTLTLLGRRAHCVGVTAPELDQVRPSPGGRGRAAELAAAARVEGASTTRAPRVAGRRGAGQAVKELPTVVQALAPVLLAQPGVGPVTAAQLLTSWSHPARRRSQAAVAMFAVLAGVAPIPACCGQVVRDRPNGGGDRAVHAVMVVHQACHEPDQPPATWPAAAPRQEPRWGPPLACPCGRPRDRRGCWSARSLRRRLDSSTGPRSTPTGTSPATRHARRRNLQG
jgi:Transposase IS116/IS110/IS902 family